MFFWLKHNTKDSKDHLVGFHQIDTCSGHQRICIESQLWTVHLVMLECTYDMQGSNPWKEKPENVLQRGGLKW